MDRSNRTLPTFITLVIVAVLLMTFDVRLQGEGVVGVIRGGTQTLLSPLQRAATIVVDPVADFLDGLGDITSLRENNDALRAELAEAQAALAEAGDDLARLETLERLYDLDLDETEVARTPANVIGRADQFDLAFQIDKGTNDGVLEDQPVIDSFGFVVGTVSAASPNTAIVVPITASRNQVTVLVGSQTGLLEATPGSNEMTLHVFDAREPVALGDQVVTAASNFPAGLAVGEVLEDAEPESTALQAVVRPFVDVEALRVVVVLAWPPDPSAATTTTTPPTTVPSETTVPDGSTPPTTGGGG
ncbi:MAG TPA: rod shape-determining protein MreC [Acidimicrobiia bacterium]|nr:rod shape-determining protein MreC [Acidimicrobiia bacterium]